MEKVKNNLSVTEEEQIFSPWRTAFINFKRRKVSVVAIFVFIFIFLCCMILPIFFPLDISFTDVTQQNIRPGRSMMNLPSALKTNARDIAVGSTFGVGVDNNGKVYQWGIYPSVLNVYGPNKRNKLDDIPDMGKIRMVTAGLDHAVAVAEDGKIYTWGNDRLNIPNIPAGLENKYLVQIEAGQQFSTALDDAGFIYIWGNENFVSLQPGAFQGRIKQYAINTTTVIALIDDGTVECLTNREVPFKYIPESVGNRAVMVASTDRCAAALLNDGTIEVWGSIDYGEDKIPGHVQGRAVSIVAGRNHFTALLNDGTVASWGKNDKYQTNAPKLAGIEYLHAGYYQNYAVDGNGKVYTWGFKGYLMGSDQFGRDVFVRLIYAGRMTMLVGSIAVIISAIIGVLVGGISGYYAGTVDIILMRVAEIVSSMPFYPLAIILSAIIGNSISDRGRVVMIMFILGFLNWPGLARLTRAQFLAERENEYVTAARSVGIREFIIIFRHILPNVMPIILVSLTLSLASSMLIESTLSFVGFGVREPNPTWGNMLNGCVDSFVIANLQWRWIFPSLALGLSVLSINTVGDGFRDAIDPKSNDR